MEERRSDAMMAVLAEVLATAWEEVQARAAIRWWMRMDGAGQASVENGCKVARQWRVNDSEESKYGHELKRCMMQIVLERKERQSERGAPR